MVNSVQASSTIFCLAPESFSFSKSLKIFLTFLWSSSNRLKAAFWAAGISDLFMLTPVCNALINIRRSCLVKAYSNSHAIGGRSARFGVRLVGGTNTGTRAIPIGIAPGELGAEQENLRRVIHPDQYNDQGTGGGQRGDGGALAQVQAYTRLPDLK